MVKEIAAGDDSRLQVGALPKPAEPAGSDISVNSLPHLCVRYLSLTIRNNPRETGSVKRF